MSLDIPNAYIQTQLPEGKRGERVIMKDRGLLVQWLISIDPISYTPFVVMERGVKTLYLLVCKAIYRMLEAGLHWYCKFRANLESIGFKFNVYDACVVNRMVNGLQQSVRFHVDDVLPYHVNSLVYDNFGAWCQKSMGL